MTKLQDLLKGLSPGRIQTVGYLQVIPLVSEINSEKFGSFLDVDCGTTNYGTVVIDNKSNQADVIMPLGYGFLKKNSGQDHALVNVTIVGKGKRVTDNTAACIQSEQGGAVSMGKHDVTILPYTIRQDMLTKPLESGFQKLWPLITVFNEKVGIKSRRQHIEDYRDRYTDDLDANLAHFERVYQQRGAIILIDGDIVGIEVAPNYHYFADEWNPLIRESYGSLAIQYRKTYGEQAPAPKTKVKLDRSKIADIDRLQIELKAAQEQEQEKVKDIVRDALELTLEEKKLYDKNNIMAMSVTSERFVGQIVRDQTETVYVSLVSQSSWFDHRQFHRSKDFEI